MPTIDDLRSSLDDHARSLHDDGLTGRASAVHGRVRTVRNRRRVAVAVGTAAAAAVVAAVVVLPGSSPSPAPADRTLVGLEAPATMTSLGYSYDFATGSEGSARATATIRRDSGPVLVSWATAGSDQKVTVHAPGAERYVTKVADFADFVVVPEGASGRVVVTAPGDDVALAVYELDPGSAPAGHTEDGTTFRQDVAGARLLAADIVGRGEAELSVELEVPEGVVAARSFCSGGPENAYVHVKIEDEGVVEGSGCADSTFDPGALGGVAFSSGISGVDPGDTVRVKMWVTEGRDGPLVMEPDMRLGLGLYEETPAVRVTGFGAPSLLEHEGHTWRVAGQHELRGRALDASVTAEDGPRLVLGVWSGVGDGTVTATVDGERTAGSFQASGGSTLITLVSKGEGTDVGLELLDGGTPRTRLGVVIYERLG